MKTRIKEIINYSGDSLFIPQRKVMFWWVEIPARPYQPDETNVYQKPTPPTVRYIGGNRRVSKGEAERDINHFVMASSHSKVKYHDYP